MITHQLTDAVLVCYRLPVIKMKGICFFISIISGKFQIMWTDPFIILMIDDRFIQKKEVGTFCSKLPHILHHFQEKSMFIFHAVIQTSGQ